MGVLSTASCMFWKKLVAVLGCLKGSIVLFAVGLLLLAPVACDNEGNGHDELVFMAGYKAQANLPFAASYIAQEKGFFADQNLDVTIRHASGGEQLKLLLAGDVDVTTADATSVLKLRSDPGLPLVAFALFGQVGQQAFVTLDESGIESPKDWEGKIFGYKVSQPPEYLGILRANNVDRSKIQEVRVGFDPRVLTAGQVDILAVFKSNEPDIIRNLGFEVSVWDPADYGVPTMGLTYVTREEMRQGEPNKITRFLRATMQGLQYALENPEEALNIIMLYAVEEDREHQRFMLEMELEDAVSPLTDQYGLGWTIDEQWRGLYEQLYGFGALSNPFDYRMAYTDDHLKDVYDEGVLRWS